MSQFNEHTPIEEYSIGNRIVYVKREDLLGKYPAPKLGKLRGLRILIEKLYKRGIRLVGCWDTRVSTLGQGVAAICKEYKNLNCIISYPTKKGTIIPKSIEISRSLGAEIFPVRGNHVSICYSQVKKYVTRCGGEMLPFGLECTESVNAIANEAKKIPNDLLKGGTIILSCGSGVTLTGLLKGLRCLPNKIVGISSGRSIEKINRCIFYYLTKIPNEVILLPPPIPYYDTYEIDCPFPSHPNYDLKAWKYLVDNINEYQDPILFWNIGSLKE